MSPGFFFEQFILPDRFLNEPFTPGALGDWLMKYTSLISAIAGLTVISATCFCLVFVVVSFNALDAAAEENIGPSFDCDKASTPTEYLRLLWPRRPFGVRL